MRLFSRLFASGGRGGAVWVGRGGAGFGGLLDRATHKGQLAKGTQVATVTLDTGQYSKFNYSKVVGFGGSMVARLTLGGIDGRAPPQGWSATQTTWTQRTQKDLDTKVHKTKERVDSRTGWRLDQCDHRSFIPGLRAQLHLYLCPPCACLPYWHCLRPVCMRACDVVPHCAHTLGTQGALCVSFLRSMALRSVPSHRCLTTRHSLPPPHRCHRLIARGC